VKAADTPIRSHNEKAQYVWMPLEKGQALAPSEQDLCVSSASNGTDHQQHRERRKTTVASPSKNGIGSSSPATAASASTAPTAPVTEPASLVHAPRSNGDQTESGPGDLIEEVRALQGVLRDALTRTAHLLHGLKQQRKQSRLVRNTLASLRQLQLVAE
jgi:hypothetical protein